MTNLATQYMDLLASGDDAKIKCVLGAAAGGSLTGGIAAGLAFAPTNVVPGAGTAINGVAAAIGAVAGVLIGAKAGMRACAAGTEGALDKILVGQTSRETLDRARIQLRTQLQMSDAQLSPLIKAAAVEVMSKGPAVASYTKPDRGMLLLVSDRLSAAGIV